MIRRFALVLAVLVSLSACAAEPPAKPAEPGAATPARQAAARLPATPDEKALRAAIEKLAPGAKVDNIAPSPIEGFREVTISGRVVYVSNDGKFLMQGPLFDTGARRNLTQISEGIARKSLLDEAGPDRRIIFAADNPKYRITVFTDIDCGYCRRMHAQIADYNERGITVEYLFFPRDGIGSESFEKAISVWCSPDRQLGMTLAKAGETLPRGTCANPVTMDFDLGRRAGVDGTPAVYSSEGMQLGGYLSPAEMLTRLDELAGAKR